jgi:hypothetical protein
MVLLTTNWIEFVNKKCGNPSVSQSANIWEPEKNQLLSNNFYFQPMTWIAPPINVCEEKKNILREKK